MKEKICIHLIPTYKNIYLDKYTFYNATDTSVGDLAQYDRLLEKLAYQYEINQIIIDGGEISNLSDLYFDLLYKIVKLYTTNIKICTSFKTFNSSLINGTDVITVKYNFIKDETIFKNIKAAIQIGKIINIETFDIACINENPIELITQLNKLNIKTFEIIPYIKTKYTNTLLNYTSDVFEKSILNLLPYTNEMNFAFYNKLQLDGLIINNNYEQQTIYITPNNKYAIENYTTDFFELIELDDLSLLISTLQKQKELQKEYCRNCHVKLKCMANYYKPFIKAKDSSCDFSKLIYQYSAKKE